MAAAIKATAVSTDPNVRSSIAHAVAAAKQCIANARIDVTDIDLLINVGVYRDANMVEPAMAALIQKEIGLSLDFVKHKTNRVALGFDLMNGGCGLLNAVQVASAFLEIGKAEYVLIVSSDAHPSNRDVPEFRYATVGAAMLLGRATRPGQGFGRVITRDGEDDYLGLVGFLPQTHGGRDNIVVQRHPDYVPRLLQLTARAVRDYVASSFSFVDVRRTLLITSQVTPDFGTQLARELGLDEAAVSVPTGLERDPHSSALTFGYHWATTRGQDRDYDQLLFVAAGAGLTTACALYRK